MTFRPGTRPRRAPESAPPDRLGGWSRMPLRDRLPVIGLVALAGVGAVYRSAAPLVFVGVLFLYLVSRWQGRRSAALAALLPAAAILMWRALPAPVADVGGADCESLLSPPAIWRLLQAVLAVAIVGFLVFDRRTTARELGVRLGSRGVVLASIVALAVIGPLAVWFSGLVGGVFGEVFFGSFALDLTRPAALGPALVFATSNAVAEELAYRGAMRAWLAPTLGVVGANLAQAVLFGLSHTGDDFVGASAVIPTAAAMVLVGFVGGVIARRTGTLLPLIAIHLAADIPLYYYWACRA